MEGLDPSYSCTGKASVMVHYMIFIISSDSLIQIHCHLYITISPLTKYEHAITHKGNCFFFLLRCS